MIIYFYLVSPVLFPRLVSATNCHKIDVSDFDKELATKSGERACRVVNNVATSSSSCRRYY
jgi:hypothetical protein